MTAGSTKTSWKFIALCEQDNSTYAVRTSPMALNVLILQRKLDEGKSKYAGLAQEDNFGYALQFASGGRRSSARAEKSVINAI
jgi:hypothetical protein